jgi:hypothetical protein
MGKKDDERTAARDFVMARLLAARAAASAAVASLDEAAMLFCDPDEDGNGKLRAELLESADGEPEADDDDDEDD